MTRKNGEEEKIKVGQVRAESLATALFPDWKRVGRKLKHLFETYDPSAHYTTISKLEAVVATAKPPSPLTERIIVRLFKVASRSATLQNFALKQLDELVRTAKAQTKNDRRSSLLLKLIREADFKNPLAGVSVTSRHFDAKSWLPIIAAAQARIEQIGYLNRDRRATAVADAYYHVSEHIYKPYLMSLVYLGYFRNGKNEKQLAGVSKLTFRQCQDYVVRNLVGYEKAFHKDVVALRNCIAHEHATYLPKTDSYIFLNNGAPLIVKIDDLLARTQDMYKLAAETMPVVCRLYMMRDVYRDKGLAALLLKEIPQLATEKDPMKIRARDEALRQEFGRRLKRSH